MDRFKKFFEKKAGKKSFKNCGVGHRLSDEPPSKMPIANVGKMQKETNESPSVQRITTADIAAQAAFKRMNLGSRQESSTQRAIRLQALRELEKERDLQEQSITGSKHECEVREFEHCNMLEEIYFTCDLLGSDKKFTESEMKRSLESFLRSQLRSDGIVASVLILFSLNATDKRQQAVETLKKYVTNVMENPSVAKYRRIRLDNHIFQERVAPVKGSRDFLEACGFEECSEVVTEGDEPRKFLVISEEKANDASKLLDALEALNEGQPVPLKLHRNPVWALVFQPSNRFLKNNICFLVSFVSKRLVLGSSMRFT
ncbi:hypothetical protein AB6A40_007291 [Gnathostoma spinigerum]|uniref:PUB domain-containing protein n=1 Tax=Gnathostoma spinigerum TaxID=75299 RepID=A0ABD6EV71_9BILA